MRPTVETRRSSGSFVELWNDTGLIAHADHDAQGQVGELRVGREARIVGESIWSDLLRRKAGDLDPSRPYHQSSPYGTDKADFNDEATGDRHNWEVWARWRPTDAYLADEGRFLSEFGVQSLPAMDTIRAYAPGAERIDDADLRHHQRMPQGQERLARYVAESYLLPQSLEDWVEATQRVQADVLRRAVEHWRRRRFATAGALIWQLHDAWPCASWSLIDFYRRPKLAYVAARRFFAPALLTAVLMEGDDEVGYFAPPGTAHPQAEPPAGQAGVEAAPEAACALDDAPVARRLRLVLVNDTDDDLNGTLVVAVEGTAGGAGPAREVLRRPLSAPANGRSEAVDLDLGQLGLAPGDLDRCVARAEFDPDGPDDCALLLAVVQNRVQECVEDIRDQGDIPAGPAGGLAGEATAAESNMGGLPWRPDFAPALSADVVFVAPKFLRWADGVEVFGLGRPAWHPAPDTAAGDGAD